MMARSPDPLLLGRWCRAAPPQAPAEPPHPRPLSRRPSAIRRRPIPPEAPAEPPLLHPSPRPPPCRLSTSRRRATPPPGHCRAASLQVATAPPLLSPPPTSPRMPPTAPPASSARPSAARPLSAIRGEPWQPDPETLPAGPPAMPRHRQSPSPARRRGWVLHRAVAARQGCPPSYPLPQTRRWPLAGASSPPMAI